MSFTEKVDVLDLLIQVLRDHEAKLDELIERLETATCAVENPPNYPRLYEIAKAVRKGVERPQVDDTENMARFYDRFPGEC